MRFVRGLQAILLFSALVGCSNGNSPVNESVVKEKQDIKSDPLGTKAEPPIEQWQSYSNARYGYFIKFPADWPKGDEAGNGGGAWLYVGNPDIEIVTFANALLDEVDPFAEMHKAGFHGDPIKLDNGEQAMLISGREGSKIVYETVAVHNGLEIHFRADVPEIFYKENEKNLFKVAKSLDFPH